MGKTFFCEIMREITSATNEYVKLLSSLKQKKYRDIHGKYIVEGEKTVLEALCSGAEVESVIVCEADCAAASAAQAAGVDTVLLPRDFFHHISDTKTPPKELACVKKAEATSEAGGRFYVALDGVADPKNLGTIIRTADAMGADAVWLSPDCADHYGPKAQRAAMGSGFHLNVEVCELIERLQSFRAAGGSVVAGSLQGSEGLCEYERVCVVIGNEARGVSREVLDIADVRFKIEMYGRAESLNAAVAAGIMLYEMRHRLKG